MKSGRPAGYRGHGQPPPAQPAVPPPGDSHSVILVTAGYDHTIRFWEALSGICSRTIQHPDSQVNKLCISPDKRFLAAGGQQHIRLYDINSLNPNPVHTFEGHTNNITSIAFHADGKWMVSGSEDGTLKIWDTRTPVVQRNYDHKAPVNDVVIHPNSNQLISCDQSGSIKLWNLGDNSCTHELVPEDDVAMRSVTISSDGTTLVAGSTKGSCYVWKMANGCAGDLTAVTKFTAHTKYLTKCLLSPDSKLLATCSADSTVKIWNTSNYQFKLEKTLTGFTRWVWDCAFSADSAYLVTASSDNISRLWELGPAEAIRQYKGHVKSIVCVALNDLSI
ncbi:TOR complex subunit lst8 [Entomophthora muscae]|uniref:TOR complex subunit lst8 n=1 Tax=Entomophthora muscae TaxID=34485 RepID=A0ACC2THW4_9FUNG|nr:TOR complex subunit lst8 [Entomophthora muscae]